VMAYQNHHGCWVLVVLAGCDADCCCNIVFSAGVFCGIPLNSVFLVGQRYLCCWQNYITFALTKRTFLYGNASMKMYWKVTNSMSSPPMKSFLMKKSSVSSPCIKQVIGVVIIVGLCWKRKDYVDLILKLIRELYQVKIVTIRYLKNI
jgi:hypothetical protein